MAEASYSQIMIGRAMTGVIGLQEIIAALHQDGMTPDDPALGVQLLSEFSKRNYVPPTARAAYEEALRREYRRYVEAQRTGQTGRLWRDARKEHRPWFPTLFEPKCDGCGKCLDVCPNGVLGWNADETKVLVLEPYECAPACQRCAQACPLGAIVMPPMAVLHVRTDSPERPSTSDCATCGSKDCVARKA